MSSFEMGDLFRYSDEWNPSSSYPISQAGVSHDGGVGSLSSDAEEDFARYFIDSEPSAPQQTRPHVPTTQMTRSVSVESLPLPLQSAGAFLFSDKSSAAPSPLPMSHLLMGANTSSFDGVTPAALSSLAQSLVAAANQRKRSAAQFDSGLSSYDESYKRRFVAKEAPTMPIQAQLQPQQSFSLGMNKKDSSSNNTMVAQYQMMSVDTTLDGFYAANVNINSASVPFGVDDVELGLATSTETLPAQKDLYETSYSSEAPYASPPMAVSVAPSQSAPASLPTVQPLSQLSAEISSAIQSQVEAGNDAGAANLENRLVDGDNKGDGLRRAKRRLTDKQRRAKIKDGLEQLRSLVALHGNASTDQASIVASSVDLVQQLVNEQQQLRSELNRVREENQVILTQSTLQSNAQLSVNHESARMQPPSPTIVNPTAALAAAASTAVSALVDNNAISNLLHTLTHINQNNQSSQQSSRSSPTPQNASSSSCSESSTPAPSTAAASSAISQLIAADPSLAESLDHIILSSYFLQTLQLLSKLPKNY